jgi:RimJ/RimL family protein N-acetyltransferase
MRVLHPGDEPVLESFLLPRVESSMFLIGNMRASGLVDGDQPYEGTYAAAFDGASIVSVVAHYWTGTLVFQAPAHLESLWRVAVQASGRPIKGLIGPNDQVGVVKDLLNIKRSDMQMDETENLYNLPLRDLIVPDDLRSGRVRGRRIEPRDLELVLEWTIAYDVEALKEVDSPELREQNRVSIERAMREGRTWLLEDQGEPVACSSFNTAIREAVQVGGVWTPPELRRHGYGRAVVAASLLDARAEGVTQAILFTGEDNVPAQKAYIALGFRHVGDYRILLLRAPLASKEHWTQAT